MSARAAYIRSFGISGLLVLAALVMLAIVSAIVAFNGWPTAASATRVEAIPLEVPGTQTAPETTVVRVRPRAPDAPRGRARDAARARHARLRAP